MDGKMIGLFMVIYVVLFTLIFICGGIACSEGQTESEKGIPLTPTQQKKKMGFLFGAILCFGLLFSSIGGMIYATSHVHKLTWDPAQAFITGMRYDNVNDSHTFLVTYFYQDQWHEQIPLSYYDSFMGRGDEVSILVNPKDPDRIEHNTAFPWAAAMFWFFGGSCLLLGLYNIVSILRGTSRWVITSTETPETFGMGPNPTHVIAGKGFQMELDTGDDISPIWKWLFITVICLIISGCHGYAVWQFWQTNRLMAYGLIVFYIYVVLNMLNHYRKHVKEKKEEEARKNLP